MTNIPKAALHHIALTVTDIDASVAWYERIFSVSHRIDVPHQGGVGKILADAEQRLMFALHHHDSNGGSLFDERRNGLDHIGLAVTTRAELEQWQQHLEANGVIRGNMADKPLTQSPIADETYASVLVFRDPDNIQLELFAPAATRGSVPQG